MVLFASSAQSAREVSAALGGAGFDASARLRNGAHVVSVKVAEDREAEVLGIAKAVDSAIQVQPSRP